VRVPVSPRRDDVVSLRDGRTLAFAEWGDPDAPPLFFFHGAPGSRVWPIERTGATRPARLITVDRPGYGRSDPHPGAAVATWAEDVAELADRLSLERFALAGWSMGGPFALAVAARLPERVTRVGLASMSRIPPDEGHGAVELLPPPLREKLEEARTEPDVLVELWPEEEFWRGFEDPEKVFDLLPEVDQWVAADADARAVLVESMREGLRSGIQGMVREEVMLLRPWGFALSDIHTPVELWHGDADRVPLARPEFIVGRLLDGRLNVWSGEGHCALLRRWDEIVASLT